MDFDFSDEQRMLRESIAAVCGSEHALAALRAAEQDSKGFPRALWQAITDAGFAGIFIAEAHGGAALDYVSAAVIYEEFGAQLAITPHFVSSFLATSLILEHGSESLQAEWLPLLASGERLLTVAVEEPGRSASRNGILCQASAVEGEIRLHGVKHLVAYAADADAVIVFARDQTEADPAAYLLPMNTAGVQLEFQPNLGNESLFRLTLDEVRIPAALKLEGDAWVGWEKLVDKGGILLAAFCAGATQRVLDMSNTYAKERVQFGKPIGAFQAIAHMLAEMATEADAARTLAYYAAWLADSGADPALAANQAKLFASAAFREASARSIQIHGGFGFTIEADPQLFFRRAKHLQLFHGDPDQLADRIADQLLGKTGAQA
jgi:alkylation response protein AidB-like acyl-CoA dehydrogenase